MKRDRNLKKLVSLTLLILFSRGFRANARQARLIELTSDNPSTLRATNSRDYSILGLRLGMSRDTALKVLSRQPSFIGVQDAGNASRIYVYRKNPDGGRGQSILYLIWEPDERRLSRIVVYNSFAGRLTRNFRRLLTSEALDEKSPFIRAFIGSPDRSGVTLDIPSIDSKNTTYYYERIGLEVTLAHFGHEESVMFAIVEPSGGAAAAAARHYGR
jgi:hypothetical protein